VAYVIVGIRYLLFYGHIQFVTHICRFVA
jgi:hypothetical protein